LLQLHIEPCLVVKKSSKSFSPKSFVSQKARCQAKGQDTHSAEFHLLCRMVLPQSFCPWFLLPACMVPACMVWVGTQLEQVHRTGAFTKCTCDSPLEIFMIITSNWWGSVSFFMRRLKKSLSSAMHKLSLPLVENKRQNQCRIQERVL
jgi:hypothetical protein